MDRIGEQISLHGRRVAYTKALTRLALLLSSGLTILLFYAAIQTLFGLW